MAILTADRPARHRLARRPAHERLADWLERPHPRLHEFIVTLGTRMAVTGLPISIVVVAVTTKGSV